MIQLQTVPSFKTSFTPESTSDSFLKGFEGSKGAIQRDKQRKFVEELSKPDAKEPSFQDLLKGGYSPEEALNFSEKLKQQKLAEKNHEMVANFLKGGGRKSSSDESPEEDRSLSAEEWGMLKYLNPKVSAAIEKTEGIKAADRKERLEREKFKQETFAKERGYHTEQLKDYAKEVRTLRTQLPHKESALNIMRQAIENNEGGLNADYIAKRMGFEPLLGLEGAVLQTGLKEFLLSNIGRAGSRPNMWLEQQISGMLPQLGRSKEANLAVTEALESETKMQRKKLELHDALADEYKKSLGYVPEDIETEVDKRLKPVWDAENGKLAYKIQQLREQERGFDSLQVLKKVPKGTPLTLEKANVFLERSKNNPEKARKMAKALGYNIITSIYEGE